MHIKNAKYTDEIRRAISATVDGIDLGIPVSPGNREYDEMVRQDIVIADPDPIVVNISDEVETQMTQDSFMRAWVKRQARKEGKTPQQIRDEIIADAE